MTQNKLSPTLSFEVFPPNSKVGTAKLIDTLDDFKELAPSFISVTCSNSALNVEETRTRHSICRSFTSNLSN